MTSLNVEAVKGSFAHKIDQAAAYLAETDVSQLAEVAHRQVLHDATLFLIAALIGAALLAVFAWGMIKEARKEFPDGDSLFAWGFFSLLFLGIAVMTGFAGIGRFLNAEHYALYKLTVLIESALGISI